MSEPALRARELSMRFGEVEALRAVELAVTGTGVFGFLGQNGAGKSTLMHLANGFFAPSGGAVEIFGKRAGPTRTSPRRQVGYLQQQPAFYEWMSGREELVWHGRLMGLSRHDARAKAAALGERLGVAEALDRRVGGYSGGMKQRLGIARALLGDPLLLLLDEPVSALDPGGRAEVLELLAELGRAATVFFSTHLLVDVERVAQRVTVIHRGRILMDAPLGELQRRTLKPLLELSLPAVAVKLAEEIGRDPIVVHVESRRDDEALVLRLEVTDVLAAQRRLPALVAARGEALLSLVPVRPSLEEAFLHLVREDEDQP
jgi:ABC-2 type transport system ATP-binding protein